MPRPSKSTNVAHSAIPPKMFKNPKLDKIIVDVGSDSKE